MAVFSIGPVVNLNPDLSFRSTSVELSVGNASGAAIDAPGVVVNAYHLDPTTETVATLYFTTTFSLGAPNEVKTLNIDSSFPIFIIRVQFQDYTVNVEPSDIEIYAQGRDSDGNIVPEHAFPFGDWRAVEGSLQ